MKTGKQGDVGAHLDSEQRCLHTVAVLHGATLKSFWPVLLLHIATHRVTDVARMRALFCFLIVTTRLTTGINTRHQRTSKLSSIPALGIVNKNNKVMISSYFYHTNN